MLDGRSELLAEVGEASEELRRYIAASMRSSTLVRQFISAACSLAAYE